jgi:hypothetical protein
MKKKIKIGVSELTVSPKKLTVAERKMITEYVKKDKARTGAKNKHS